LREIGVVKVRKPAKPTLAPVQQDLFSRLPDKRLQGAASKKKPLSDKQIKTNRDRIRK
jgi:hypothetical protein